MALKFNPKNYWEERLSKHYDLLGVGDISLTVNYNRWSYRVTKRRLKRIFRRYTPPHPGAVLDIGSGTGFVIDIWEQFNKKLFGIDISASAVSMLKAKYPDAFFFELDAGKDNLPFEMNSFQVVSASSVLYHVVEDDSLMHLLKNVQRVLTPGGYFIFSDNFIHKSKLSVIHQKCRTLEDYQQLLNDVGFEIIDRVANYVIFNDPVDANGKFFPRLWCYLTKYAKRYRWFDALIWPLLYPVELFLTSFVKESPAQEIMICRVIK